MPGMSRSKTPVEASGRLAVEVDGDILGDWNIEAVPDRPPTVAFGKPPQATERNALMLVYKAEDDYGLDRVRAEMRRTYERGTVIGKEVETLELALPRPGVKSRPGDQLSRPHAAPMGRYAGGHPPRSHAMVRARRPQARMPG